MGFLAGITGDEMNQNFNELRRQFRQDAIDNEKVLDKAKLRADSVMQLMFGPMIRSMNRNYKLELRFKDTHDQLTEDELRRRGETPGQQPNAQKPQTKMVPK